MENKNIENAIITLFGQEIPVTVAADIIRHDAPVARYRGNDKKVQKDRDNRSVAVNRSNGTIPTASLSPLPFQVFDKLVVPTSNAQESEKAAYRSEKALQKAYYQAERDAIQGIIDGRLLPSEEQKTLANVILTVALEPYRDDFNPARRSLVDRLAVRTFKRIVENQHNGDVYADDAGRLDMIQDVAVAIIQLVALYGEEFGSLLGIYDPEHEKIREARAARGAVCRTAKRAWIASRGGNRPGNSRFSQYYKIVDKKGDNEETVEDLSVNRLQLIINGIGETLDAINKVVPLDKQDRNLLIFRFVHNESIEELADRFGKAVGTIKSNIFRLLEKIRVEIAKNQRFEKLANNVREEIRCLIPNINNYAEREHVWAYQQAEFQDEWRQAYRKWERERQAELKRRGY